MRIAALFDIHGNLPALEAVLAEVREANVDRLLIGGDVVPGPFPRETVMRLLDADIPTQFIYGNCEVALLDVMAGLDPSGVPEQHRGIFRWSAQKLAGYEELFGSWPRTLHIEVPGLGNVLFYHATPRNENEIFTRLTAEERLLPIFEGLEASVVVCGHTHMQFDRMIGSTRVVNAGSVGMPFGEPGADWLLLGPGIELKHTSYDLALAAGLVRASDYPDAGNFIKRTLLNPPAEKEMLELFSGAELK
jgi:predicted phosphodiesterase